MSCLPVVDASGVLLDIFARADIAVLAKVRRGMTLFFFNYLKHTFIFTLKNKKQIGSFCPPLPHRSACPNAVHMGFCPPLPHGSACSLMPSCWAWACVLAGWLAPGCGRAGRAELACVGSCAN